MSGAERRDCQLMRFAECRERRARLMRAKMRRAAAPRLLPRRAMLARAIYATISPRQRGVEPLAARRY